LAIHKNYKIAVVGSGPNGLSAAVLLAQAGHQVTVFEEKETIGGGTRTQEVTLPGFHHDICSAIHPMAYASPFFKTLPLEKYGLEWIQPTIPLAHPLSDTEGVSLYKNIEQTAEQLGKDYKTYKNLFSNFTENCDVLLPQLLGPFSIPQKNIFPFLKFGINAIQPSSFFTNLKFKDPKTKSLFTGMAAHGIQPLSNLASSAIGLVLTGIGHKYGWPFPKGGSFKITESLKDYLEDLGGKIKTGHPIHKTEQLKKYDKILFDITPKQIINIAQESIPKSYLEKLKKFNYGYGVFKIDYALKNRLNWNYKAANNAGTIHLCGDKQTIERAEKEISLGKHPTKPFILIAQQSNFDQTRAPNGKHTLWAYCHVPKNSTRDMTAVIEAEIEKAAPGFKESVLARNTMNTQNFETYNANYIGGDINGGAQDISQLFHRPVNMVNPYHIPKTNMYICSSSSPPGGGVHGMNGFHAANAVLNDLKNL
jgi:phytoene dehydrogenase-like protein